MAKSITISTPNRKVEAAWGRTLREILLDNDLTPYKGTFKTMNCHGLGICGSCLVEIREEGEWRDRRSCQIQCFSDLEIRLK